MADITFSIPGMYADHHVTAVVDALNTVEGISKIVASSSRRKLTVTFDSKRASADQIESAVTKAGYPVQRVEGAIREEDLNFRSSDATPERGAE